MTLRHTCRRSAIRGLALSFLAVLPALPASSWAADTAPSPPAAAPAAASPAAPPAAADTVDLSAMVRDLSLNSSSGDKLIFAMWMPEVFWRASFQSSGQMPSKLLADYMAVIHPYTLVAVLDAQRGITAFRYADTATLLSEVTIEDAHGTTYEPIPLESVSDEMRNLISMLRPLLANMMGAMGQHMEILAFPGIDKAGKPVADARQDGSLTVHVGGASLRYRLPLGSVLPPAVDLKTGESFPGNYHYSPYTGNKLVPRPADTHAGSTKP